MDARVNPDARLIRRATRLLLAAALAALPATHPALGGDEKAARKVWGFESDEPGKIASGFTGAVGTWEVARDGDNQVLAQKARSEDRIFNVALNDEFRAADVDMTVRVKSVDGQVDQGGGMIWRARDAKNYYIARFNPLESNYRVYKVVDGKRTQLGHAKAPDDMGWHTLRVTMSGSSINCDLDGKRLLRVEDATFPGPGMVGLWCKADAQSYFDDFTVSEAK